MIPTIEVLTAMEHVQQFFPEARIVVFDVHGRWVYFDEEFRSGPAFPDNVNVDILEAASDSVPVLPYIYQQYDESEF